MTAYCAHPGCVQALHSANKSGVCRGHMHCEACRCAWCCAPRRVVNGRPLRVIRHLRIKTRGELIAEGLLLPGFDILRPDLATPTPVFRASMKGKL